MYEKAIALYKVCEISQATAALCVLSVSEPSKSQTSGTPPLRTPLTAASLFSLPTEMPLKDGEDVAAISLSDSPLFSRWGHDMGPESRRVALQKFQYYGYNGYLSDRLSLDRAIPDLRPDG